MSRFVVHKHNARQLHYDMRLEVDGVLVSWAVPKGVPLRAGVKRLAIKVDDHALSYIDFEGVIPEGMYGAGTVEIWDRGTYTNMRSVNMAQSVQEGLIEVHMHGTKVDGVYVLVKAEFQVKPGAQSLARQGWLLFKKRA